MNGLRSGDYLPVIYIGLIDKYGEVVSSINNAKLTIQITYTYSPYL